MEQRFIIKAFPLYDQIADLCNAIIKLVEDKEGDNGVDMMMKAADLFKKDTRTPIAYLAFTKRELCSTWLHHMLDQVAQEAAVLQPFGSG